MATKKDKERSKPDLAATLQKKFMYARYDLWIVGDTPLIVHAWSEKAKREMLGKQVGATGPKDVRDPEGDFKSSLYEMGNGTYGFPAMAFKKAIINVAHVDLGIAKTDVMAALWVDAQMVRTRPALAGAICDMPLLRVYGGKPEMREDMTKIGGFKKIAQLSYRGQFTIWAVKFSGRINVSRLPENAFSALIDEAGMSTGVGEWRQEKSGMFGAFQYCSTLRARASQITS